MKVGFNEYVGHRCGYGGVWNDGFDMSIGIWRTDSAEYEV